MTSTPTLDLDLAQEVLSTVDRGLSRGLGEPRPGEMCVEAAVCYALGLDHSDDPGCVAPSLREFVVALNDAPWSSRESRASGLRKLAIAQLGSLGVLDDVEFSRRLAERVIKEILPETLRRLNVLIPLSLVPRVEAAAERCEREGSSSAAMSATELLTELLVELPEKSEEWTEPEWALWDASEPARLAATKTAKLAARASLQAAEAKASLKAAKAFELSLKAAKEATAWRHRDALFIAESAAIDSSSASAAAIQAAADSASEAASAHGLAVYEAAWESDAVLRQGAEMCVEILRGFGLPGVALMDQLVSS